MTTQISLIAAIAHGGVIGSRNQLPWRIPEDLQHFKRITYGHPVIMGRNTFTSLGRPLSGRSNIVITRNPAQVLNGCITVDSLHAAIAVCEQDATPFIIGGAQIYRLSLPIATHLYLTEIDLNVPDGDAKFPDIDRNVWQEVSRDSHYSTAHQCRFDFVEYRKYQV